MSIEPPFRPHGLGEVAIRCSDLPAMIAFYRDALFLEHMAGGPEDRVVFFRIAPGVAGHTTVLALFRNEGPTAMAGTASTLHHLALSLPWEEQEKAIAHFEKSGRPFRIEIFGWVGWRGVFLTDPDGNTVELVAFNEALKDS